VVAVGYDDGRKITNTRCQRTTIGALLIRNSWGTGWGDGGYGWLPYEYVLSGLAMDFWSLLSLEWVDTQQFDLNG
jgi:C1A family cysteine protease